MTAPTWVLLRGLTRDARHWNGFEQRLAAAMPGAHVVAIDLPGTGQTHAIRSPWSIPAMAGQVRARLRAAGLEPPYSLLAISMGAMVATAWAREWPAEIDSAVLINTSMRPFSPIAQRLQPQNYGRPLRALVAPAGAAERIILRATSRARADDRPLLDQWVRHRRERPIRRVDALAQLVAAARFRAPLDNPFRRVLLLTSTRDALVDTRCTLALGRAWHCEVRSHPSAGHDLPLDDPDWVVTQTTSIGHAAITIGRHDAGS
jgi:pimeloyl-ACP methyl ester carboxylesterase